MDAVCLLVKIFSWTDFRYVHATYFYKILSLEQFVWSLSVNRHILIVGQM